jgi:hypothetical protein
MEVTHRIGFYRGSYSVSTHKPAIFPIPLRNSLVGSRDFYVEFLPQVELHFEILSFLEEILRTASSQLFSFHLQ